MSERDAARGFFITGTDTGVGKTVVTAALALCLRQRGFRVGVMKPIETGVPSDLDHHRGVTSDGERLRTAAGMDDPLDAVSPYRLSAPLAPLAAARQADTAIQMEPILALFSRLSVKYPLMLVEGVGGVRVPISDKEDVRDLIARLRLPVIVVGRSMLGGVNHALLTVEALRAREITLAGILLNEPCARLDASAIECLQMRSTIDLIRELSGARVAGPLPHTPLLQEDWEAGLARIAAQPAIQGLADWLVRADE